MFKKGPLTTLVLVCALAAFSGCGSKDKTYTVKSDDGTATVTMKHDGDGGINITSKGDKGTVNISSKDGSFEMKGEDGTHVTIGDNAALPKDMPKDVPTYPNMKLTTVTSSPKDGGLMYGAQVKADIKTVADALDKQAQSNGWKQGQRIESSGDDAAIIINYTKDDREMNFTITKDDDGTEINLVVAKQ